MSNYKRLPDSVGYWVSDDGQEVMISCGKWSRDFYFQTADDHFDFKTKSLAANVKDVVSPARWLRVEKPTFKPLPPKPLLCFVTRPGVTKAGGEWRAFVDGVICGSTLSPGGGRNRDYAVAPHPDNDPEAVRLIEESKSEIPF